VTSRLGGRRFGTDVDGFKAMTEYVKQRPDRVWAIEGCNGIGRHVAMRLIASGQVVVDVAPKLSARAGAGAVPAAAGPSVDVRGARPATPATTVPTLPGADPARAHAPRRSRSGRPDAMSDARSESVCENFRTRMPPGPRRYRRPMVPQMAFWAD
jgi:hypothetical protein